MYKKFFIFLFTLVLVYMVPFSASANAPMPADSLEVCISNLPEGAVYADLLIKIDENDPNYIEHQKSVYDGNEQTMSAYCEDGYRSFTLHYNGAKSGIKLENFYDDIFCVDFCRGSDYQDYLTQYEDLCENYRDIKIVLLDKDFEIISVSCEAKLPNPGWAEDFNGDVEYDAAKNSFEIDTRINPYMVILGSFFSGVIILISVVIELLTALLFGYNSKRLTTVAIVNVCSQVIMRVLYLILPLTYLVETVILEVLVFTSETLIYKKRFEDSRWSDVLTYTIVANVLSLAAGILLDIYVF